MIFSTADIGANIVEADYLSIVFRITAALYTSVGQAGGTGYVAVMGLLDYGPNVIKPTALALNILVAGIGVWRFARAGLVTWRSCYPFAILGAPFSVIGGATMAARPLLEAVTPVQAATHCALPVSQRLGPVAPARSRQRLDAAPLHLPITARVVAFAFAA